MSKSPQAFRSISEAAEEVGVPQHVLRFWESKFDFVAPVKRAGGRRFYRPQDIATLKAIRGLLHDDGLTIKGVQRLYKDKSKGRVPPAADALVIEGNSQAVSGMADLAVPDLNVLLTQIEAAQSHLRSVLRR